MVSRSSAAIEAGYRCSVIPEEHFAGDGDGAVYPESSDLEEIWRVYTIGESAILIEPQPVIAAAQSVLSRKLEIADSESRIRDAIASIVKSWPRAAAINELKTLSGPERKLSVLNRWADEADAAHNFTVRGLRPVQSTRLDHPAQSRYIAVNVGVAVDGQLLGGVLGAEADVAVSQADAQVPASVVFVVEGGDPAGGWCSLVAV
jgi:hypothetical protein